MLSSAGLPESPARLREMLEAELRTFVTRPPPIVTVRGENSRQLEALTIDLSGATIDHHHRPDFPRAEKDAPVVSVQQYSFGGEKIRILDAELALQLNASEVVFREALRADGKLALILNEVARGNLSFKISRLQLQTLIESAARRTAQKRGVVIDSVALDFEQPDSRIVNLKIRATGRKMIFRAALDLRGTLAIDHNFAATISNLRCTGEGNISALVCAAITPYFARIENKSFPLSHLPLIHADLHSLTLDFTSDPIQIEAQFGSAK